MGDGRDIHFGSIEVRACCEGCGEPSLVSDPRRVARCAACGGGLAVSASVLLAAVEAARTELPSWAPPVRHVVLPGALVTIRTGDAACAGCAERAAAEELEGWRCEVCARAYEAVEPTASLRTAVPRIERVFIVSGGAPGGFGVAYRSSAHNRVDPWEAATMPMTVMRRCSEDMVTRR